LGVVQINIADQYTQPPPRIVRPEPNVIVQLCEDSTAAADDQGNSAAPLTDPSNAAFAKLVIDWSKLTQRLWIWNYVSEPPLRSYS